MTSKPMNSNEQPNLPTWLKSIHCSCQEGELTKDQMNQLIRSRCDDDIQCFAYHFFRHHLSRPCGSFHQELFQLYQQSLCPQPLVKRPSRRLAIAAPRGAAKTTFKTLIFPLHAVLYRREPYIANPLRNPQASQTPPPKYPIRNQGKQLPSLRIPRALRPAMPVEHKLHHHPRHPDRRLFRRNRNSRHITQPMAPNPHHSRRHRGQPIRLLPHPTRNASRMVQRRHRKPRRHIHRR